MHNKTTKRALQELLFRSKPRDILQNKLVLALHHNDSTNEKFISEREETANRIKVERLKSKDHYENNHTTTYNVNDSLVFECEPRSTGTSRKLELHYKGPNQLARVLGNDRYVVQVIPESQSTERYHFLIYSSD